MEPNNGVSQSQPVASQPTQQPVQQQQQQQPTTPQVQYQQINSQTGQPIAQPQAPQQQQQQISDDVIATRLRSDLAQRLNVPIDHLPSDYKSIMDINAGAYSLMQRQMAERQAQSLPQQQPPQVVQQQTQTSPLAEKQLPPGWQNFVQKDQTGQWQPTHPTFMAVAQDANYNESVRAARTNALNQGQLLPEQQQSIETMMQARLSEEREKMRGEMFMNQYGNELYETNPDGTRRTQLNPSSMQSEDLPSALGMEMRAAAMEIRNSGARFDSATDLANMALKIARERVKMKQAAQPPAQTQQTPQARDLQDLLNNHQRAGTTTGSNLNTAPQQFKDFRSELRSVLQNVPDGASGMDLARAIGFQL